MIQSRRILVTSALYCANGPLHLGHILEAIQTDIWVRFQKLRGHECYYVCADDTHGTPIMLKAQSEGITPEALIDQVNIEHQRDLAEMLINFDNFGSTHSPENHAMCDRMYRSLRDGNTIDRRTVRQAYDDTANMFLPDRYVKGICPNCGTADQYGDSCENCGATYSPADLKNPVSVVSNTPPVWRDSEHYFFRLSAFESRLATWVKSGAVQDSVARKLDEWFSQGLKDWDISRDSPYFGFEIPDAPGKYFYVWFDAPIRYLDSFKAEYLRYYFAAKLGAGIDDIDMNLDEFASRCNSDIVGKLVNIASRCAGFITKNAGGTLAKALPEPDSYLAFEAAGESIAAAYEPRDTAGAIREIMSLADRANQYIDLRKPWTLAKHAAQAAEVQSICTQGLNLFRVLMIYLQPVLPEMAAQAQRFFQESAWSWDSAASPLLGTSILPYQALATRLDPKAVARLVEAEAG